MQIIHGVALNISGCGVIITGDSASGKSELGLELIARGHKFIADDAICVTCTNRKLYISNPSNQFIMHLRGIGFMDISQIFSSEQTVATSLLNCIIHLSNADLNSIAPLTQSKFETQLLGQSIAEYTLMRGNNRPLALLTEVLVKYHQQLINGHDSHSVFIRQHGQLLQEIKPCNLF